MTQSQFAEFLKEYRSQLHGCTLDQLKEVQEQTREAWHDVQRVEARKAFEDFAEGEEVNIGCKDGRVMRGRIQWFNEKTMAVKVKDPITGREIKWTVSPCFVEKVQRPVAA